MPGDKKLIDKKTGLQDVILNIFRRVNRNGPSAQYWIYQNRLLGIAGGTIALCYDRNNREGSVRLTAIINRTANKSQAPRIMGGTGLRTFFQENYKINDVVSFILLSKNTMQLN
ncbi:MULTISPECIES: hypothetical protein [Lelliottia]|uniref:hypothetical protein n=1 Tax=Lelliottia TaxID=1330545 RepID=UPI001057518D|nr:MULTISPECIES: hypothetical protein [Lelliottia]NTZ44850.1 hypothetical protein [Lelliottia aquatilis]